MATCRKCGADGLVWQPKPDGTGYFRPLEQVKVTGAGALYVVNDADLLQVNEALLQWHVCAIDKAPRPMVVVDDDPELAGELPPGPERPLTDDEERELAEQQRQAAVDQEIADRIRRDLGRYAKAKQDKVHEPYSRIECPRCEVPAGDPCRSLGSPARTKVTTRAHEWRRAAYDAATNADDGTVERPNPQAVSAGLEDLTAITWPFNGLVQHRALRTWLFDHADLLTGETDAEPAGT